MSDLLKLCQPFGRMGKSDTDRLCDHRLSEPDVKRRGMNETHIKPII